MQGFWLLIPFLLIRYGLLALLGGGDAIRRAAHFPPMVGGEVAAYWVYQVSTVALIVYPFFLKVRWEPAWLLYTGAGIYGVGLLLCALSMAHFAVPSETEVRQRGLYRFSRNPMYVAYFLCFVGGALLTRSWIFGGIVAVFQIASHGLILAEERWCARQFGEEYARYKARVRRYL